MDNFLKYIILPNCHTAIFTRRRQVILRPTHSHLSNQIRMAPASLIANHYAQCPKDAR